MDMDSKENIRTLDENGDINVFFSTNNIVNHNYKYAV